MHTQLLAQLRQCITQNGGEPYYSRWCTAMRWLCALTRRAPAGCGIGQQFLLMVPFLKFYTEYLANYDDALATLTEWARGTIPIMQVSLRSSASSLWPQSAPMQRSAQPRRRLCPSIRPPICPSVRMCQRTRACVRTCVRACTRHRAGGGGSVAGTTRHEQMHARTHARTRFGAHRRRTGQGRAGQGRAGQASCAVGCRYDAHQLRRQGLRVLRVPVVPQSTGSSDEQCTLQARATSS